MAGKLPKSGQISLGDVRTVLGGTGGCLPRTIPEIRAYTSSTVFTVPADITRIKVEMWGAGAGGDMWAGSWSYKGGGGGGGYCLGTFDTVPGHKWTIAVGASGGRRGGGDSYADCQNTDQYMRARGGGNQGHGGYWGGLGGGTASGGVINLTGQTGSRMHNWGTGVGGLSPRGGAGGTEGSPNGNWPGGGGVYSRLSKWSYQVGNGATGYVIIEY